VDSEEDDPEEDTEFDEDDEEEDEDDDEEVLSFAGAGIILISVLGTPRFPLLNPERLSSKGNFVEGTKTSPTLTSWLK
jgi:hypothetical protein